MPHSSLSCGPETAERTTPGAPLPLLLIKGEYFHRTWRHVETTSRGVAKREINPPRAPQPLSLLFDPSPTNTTHQPPPPWPLAAASPPQLRRGAYFQSRLETEATVHSKGTPRRRCVVQGWRRR